MAYTPRKQSAAENASTIRQNVTSILPDETIRPVRFYWRHRANRIIDGELVSATVWSTKQELEGRTADDGRYGFEVRVSDQVIALADEGQMLPRPIYLDIAVGMENVRCTKQIGDNRMLVLVD